MSKESDIVPIKRKNCGHQCGKFDPDNQLNCCICTDDTFTCQYCLNRDDDNECYDCGSNDVVYSDENREVMICIKCYMEDQEDD